MKESTYDFKILFEKLEEEQKNDPNMADDVRINQEVHEHIKFLKDIYDTADQQIYDILTKA